MMPALHHRDEFVVCGGDREAVSSISVWTALEKQK